MVNFFRKIRQRLLTENRFSKYLLYALGEILLVVIGILIALQINNWNELRKSNAAERLLLVNLRDDFSLRLAELEEFQTARASGIRTIHELTRIINNPDLRPSKSKMDSLVVELNNAYSFNDQFKMLDVLFSTGQINQLSNQKLKHLLLQWPQFVEEMMEEQRERIFLYNTFLQPLQFKYVSLREIYELFDFRGYNLPRGMPVTKTSDYESFLKDPILENYLSNTELLLVLNEIDSRVLISNAHEIIELLDNIIADR